MVSEDYLCPPSGSESPHRESGVQRSHLVAMSAEERAAKLSFCSEKDCSGVWCFCRENITKAIKAAENDALERAARALDRATVNPFKTGFTEYAKGLARAAGIVRELKHPAQHSGEPPSVSDGSPQGQDAKQPDPTDDSAVCAAETPFPSPPLRNEI
jgi:hypothetical protein